MALDILLSIPGIPGESQDVRFRGTIVTPSYAWALEHDALGNGASGHGSGKTTFQPLTVSKNIDKSSPLLMQALVRGTRIAAMTLLLEKTGAAGSPLFLVYQFNTVLVTSVSDSGSSGGDDVPFETVTFVFGSYQVTYHTTRSDGTLDPTPITSAWSVLTDSVPGGPAQHR